MLFAALLRVSKAVALATAFVFVTAPCVRAADAVPIQDMKLAEKAFTRSPALPPWAALSTTIPDAHSNASSVMRLAETLYYAGPRPEVLVRRVIAVNESSALGTAGQREIVFQPEYQQVTLHRVSILRKNEVLDKTASVNVRFQQPDRDNNNTVFTGWVTAIVVVDDLRVGDSLEIVYSTAGDNPVYKGRLFDNLGWDDYNLMPVTLRRIEINLPEARRVQYRLMGSATQVVPQEQLANGRRVLTFIGRDLPAPDPDNYVPGDVFPLRWLQVSELATWRDLNTWATDLFQIRPLPPEFKPVLASIDAAPDKEGKILKALDFVQNEIRYVSMSLGENSHRPFLPQEVLARRYGDCKDKSLLLVSLLRQLGIEASPVLLSTQMRRNLDTLLPSPLNFDHAIVRVMLNGKATFLDPTLRRQYGSLAVLGQPFPATQVLVVEPGTVGLTTTPPPQEALITEERQERVQIKRLDGSAALELTLRYAGLGAEAYRNARARLNPEHLRKYFSGLLDRRYTGAEMVGEPEFVDDTQANAVRITLHYRLPRFLDSVNNAWVARYEASNLTDLMQIPSNQRRSNPLNMSAYPYIGRYEFEMTVPEEFDVQRGAPFEQTVRDAGFTLTRQLSFSGRTARAKLEMRVLNDRIETTKVAAFLENLRTANRMINGYFDFDRRDLKTAARQSNLPFKQATRAELEASIQSATAQIDGPHGADFDPGTVYCERALARAYLGQTSEALADANKAVRQRPGAGAPLKCRGTIEFITGELGASLNDLSQALTHGQNDFETLFQRALAAHYLGRYAEAEADLALAQSAATLGTQRAQASYWQTLNALRGNRPAPAAPSTGNDWPAPALNLLTHRQSPAQLLQATYASSSGRELDIRLAEAYLYVGQYYLLQGERSKAQAYFQQAQEKGALFSLLHHAAGRELALSQKAGAK